MNICTYMFYLSILYIYKHIITYSVHISLVYIYYLNILRERERHISDDGWNMFMLKPKKVNPQMFQPISRKKTIIELETKRGSQPDSWSCNGNFAPTPRFLKRLQAPIHLKVDKCRSLSPFAIHAMDFQPLIEIPVLSSNKWRPLSMP